MATTQKELEEFHRVVGQDKDPKIQDEVFQLFAKRAGYGVVERQKAKVLAYGSGLDGLHEYRRIELTDHRWLWVDIDSLLLCAK